MAVDLQTVTIQIGNSDDKLSQLQWSNFVSDIDRAIFECPCDIHFSGFSQPNVEWQNACWVIAIEAGYIDDLKANLQHWREKYDQESLAFTIGQTTFI